jgi:hypothetical protein
MILRKTCFMGATSASLLNFHAVAFTLDTGPWALKRRGRKFFADYGQR